MWVEKQKNGKFKFVERYEDFMTGQTKKVSVTLDKNTSSARKVAQQALADKIHASLTAQKPQGTTFKELVNNYRIEQKMTVKRSTYTRNYHQGNTLMKLLGENILVENLSAKYIRNCLLSSGKEAGTLNEHMRRLKALLRWGYKNDYIKDISYLDKLEQFKDKPHKEKIQDKFLEQSEVNELLSGMQIDVWRLLTQFFVLSGLRFGEAAALNKDDVNIKDRILNISKTYDAINDLVTPPKTFSSNREVYIQPELEAVIKQLKACMLRQQLINNYKTNLFLASDNGQHINYYTYNKYLRENSKRILEREITPHTLRHTHASLLLEQGISIDTISRRLGHENSKVTKEIYLHVTKKLKEKDNAQLSKVQIM